MAFIDLKTYIDCPASVFELQGRCYFSEQDGVPCRIRVGPRRFLNENVHPDQLKLTLWQNVDGQVTFLPTEPVETTVDEDGALFLDAVALARKYFGKDISFCSSDHWRWNKNCPRSDAFLTTPYGVASSYSVWLDINWTHSNLRLTPGTLTLCGHDVRALSWSSFDDECGAHSLTVRPLVEKLLSGPHTMTAKELRKELKVIKDFHLNRLSISTDRGTYTLDSSLSSYIAVSLADGTSVEGFELKNYADLLTQVDVALRLMRAKSADAVRTALEMLEQQDLVCQSDP